MRRPAFSSAPRASSQAPRMPSPLQDFVVNDAVVYPTHGIGTVMELTTQKVGDATIKVIRIGFEGTQATVCVPLARASALGLRKLASTETFAKALEVMRGKPVVNQVVWARRAVDFEAKIKSGDPVQVAEVLRDLRRNADPKAPTSYSERQVFDNAARRLSSELAAVSCTSQEAAMAAVTEQLQGTVA